MLFTGLKLRLQGQTALLADYTYALFLLTDKYMSVDWNIMVTADDVQSHHIRCHQLQVGDELSMLVSNFKKQHAKAVILINTQDNYSIALQFLEGEFCYTIFMLEVYPHKGYSKIDYNMYVCACMCLFQL